MFTTPILGSVLVTSLLIGSALPVGVSTDRAPLTLTNTTWVKVHTGGQLMLQCGNRTPTGVVQYWHTPFGQVKKNGIRGNWDPVAMLGDGGLKINRVGQHHGGLYYCLLEDRDGITLRPYRLHTEDQHDHRTESGGPSGQSNRMVRAQRSAEDRGRERATAAGSDSRLAEAVAASVVVTFLAGFSAGALSRAPLLRCLGVARAKAVSLGRRSSRTPVADQCAEVILAALPPACENEASWTAAKSYDEDHASAGGETAAAVSPSPPAKPQRSFRRGREEEPEAATYLEGCDYRGGKKGSEVEGRGDGRESSEGRRDRERQREEGGGVSEWKGENEGEVKESGSRIDELEPEQRGSQSGEERRMGEREGEGERREGMGDEVACSPPCPAQRSRVIRLYQYDEEGHRYDHLPNPAPSETGPAPRPKQRSLSLTRLNAIMAAANTSPLDPPSRDMGREETDSSIPGQERPVFQLDI